MDHVFDVAIIGGGINGCGCAADAALRGLSVVLFEKDDIASKTSSNSTKLIHGGLRYLEHWEFGLVRKALKERQTLLEVAPHIVYPQAFVLPYLKSMRPSWVLRLGLFLYDHLSLSNKLPKCSAINRQHNPSLFTPLQDTINKGFMYYDGATDDARLTLFNALQAHSHTASIRTYSEVIETVQSDNFWELTIKPHDGEPYTIRARSLINAAGPWVEHVAHMTKLKNQRKMSLVKGSHIVVPRLFSGSEAYFMQHTDNRVIFAIPYQDNTLIGTTDVAFTGNLNDVRISQEEVDYLLSITNSYFKTQLKAQDVLYSWSGLRPLVAEDSKDLSKISRDYTYVVSLHGAPLITIYGGKITTYRQLAAEVINNLKTYFPQIDDTQTAITPLPGAQYGSMSFAQYREYAHEKYKWLDPELLKRYLRTYGTCMEQFLNSCKQPQDLGQDFGKSLYQVEVDYLVQFEWAKTVDDILFRRTKLGYVLKDVGVLGELSAYLRAEKSSHFTNHSIIT